MHFRGGWVENIYQLPRSCIQKTLLYFTRVASSFSSSSASALWKYDVFLSFRGEDTRKSFTDHLYAAMERKGIITFRDDDRLERGKPLSQELLKAIENSRFSIVIFSRNYASSKWCLDEVAKIVECMKMMGQTVIPVFYHVAPSEVRKQKGSFEKAFALHEENFVENTEKVQRWRAALEEVANLSGWDLQERHESEAIEEIVQSVFNKLRYAFSRSTKSLVGIDSQVDEIIRYLSTGSNEVQIVGFCGMGGIGKTTLAKVVFDKISHQFEGSSFVANVREFCKKSDLLELQHQLLSEILMERELMHFKFWTRTYRTNMIMKRLSSKKILLVLDDVDRLEQLKVLAGEQDWFVGSIIIITTRDEHLLVAHGVDKIFKIKEMNRNDAHQLFRLNAFRIRQPLEGYKDLTDEFVKYSEGLPLALEVLGSSLTGRSVNEWISALGRLKDISNREILDILRTSYEGLEEIEQKIFLDIACFFKGKDKDRVISILDSCNFHSEIGIRVLIDKSLITLSDNRLRMHDILQELGRKIVLEESPEDPGKRSRLWRPKDVIYVLKKNMATDSIKTMIVNRRSIMKKAIHSTEALLKLDDSILEARDCDPAAFSKMSRLRLLEVNRNLNLHQGLEYLSSELCYFKWPRYPLQFLPSSFPPKRIVEIHIPCSPIKRLWKGIKILEKLRVINLKGSFNLTKTPDFTGVPNLERLVLEDCPSLVEVHPSIGFLNRLSLLNLKSCISIRSLPGKLETEALHILILSSCTNVKEIPEFTVNMEKLSELWLDGTGIDKIPLSLIEHSTSISLLDLSWCTDIGCLSGSICGLTSLKKLKLRGCSGLEQLPENLGDIEGLEELDLSRTAIRKLPSSICLLKNLKVLSLEGCREKKTA
ncbi:disease resistance protein RUN1 [Ziziphus jujuba]|uniref:Disease resistance protein RUN1 n=1 Tax=Ziziphus jujuba TaxID=326968 RepID=A0A6P6GI40_ZIZJJ|nr:disease resistance protein RUN1 [Ziziphus jujuba]